jgi:hypothetical protein
MRHQGRADGALNLRQDRNEWQAYCYRAHTVAYRYCTVCTVQCKVSSSATRLRVTNGFPPTTEKRWVDRNFFYSSKYPSTRLID